MAGPPLILVPTAPERERLLALGALGGRQLELCGFGPIAAAARAASLLASCGSDRVLLLGIAGTLAPEQLAIGSAATFDAVHLDGVGAGEGTGRLSADAMGFAHWQDEEGAVGDSLPLVARAPTGSLLTVCAASATREQAEERRTRTGALAEDMEAFGVALACRLHGARLTVVRGVSNRAGDRDVGRWRIDEALEEAHRLGLETLAAW